MEDVFINKLTEIDPKSKDELSSIEAEFNCKVKCDIEKHHSLQYTYYYEVDFGASEMLFVEVENGINNGTVVVHSEWGVSTKTNTKTIQTVTDVVFSESEFERWYNGSIGNKVFTKRKAMSIFNNHKKQLLEIARKDSYDNYATGGGTLITKKHYNDEYSFLKLKGVFYEFVVEEIEVDRTFV